ncbi:hypothetical protein [Parabacteroides distasonis]|nr:hypothetical protein [Parabacteroides distasonis]
MKIAGFILLAIGGFYSLGALASGYNPSGGIIWIVIGGYLVWSSNKKRQDKEDKDKWLNGNSLADEIMEHGEENINWEEISKVMREGKKSSEAGSGADSSKIQHSKIYDSLYEELLDKCNPKNFMEPYDKKKVDAANLIYKALLESKPSYGCYSNQEIRNIKDQAVRELGISISNSLYRKLINYCDPKRFMEPYDFEAVQVANEFYSLVEKSKDDIVELEELQHKILRNEVIKSYREKEHDNVKKNVEVPSNDDNDIYAWVFLGVVIIHILLAYYLIR